MMRQKFAQTRQRSYEEIQEIKRLKKLDPQEQIDGMVKLL